MRSASTPSAPRGGDSQQTAAAHAAMDLLGQRWSLRILWELEPGQMGFLELRRRMNNCSSSMLSERLRLLQDAGVIEKNSARTYELTYAGIPGRAARGSTFLPDARLGNRADLMNYA